MNNKRPIVELLLSLNKHQDMFKRNGHIPDYIFLQCLVDVLNRKIRISNYKRLINNLTMLFSNDERYTLNIDSYSYFNLTNNPK